MYLFVYIFVTLFRFAVVGFGSARHAAGNIIPMDSNGRVFGTAFEAQAALRSIQTRGNILV